VEAIGVESDERNAAFNMEDEEGMESWLPDGPDVFAAAAEQRTHADESSKLYIGREFTLHEFARWFAVQGIGTRPYNGIGIHHTYRPVGTQFWGAKTVDAIFSYYHREYGWDLGKGPHLWLYAGDNPNYRPGQITVTVGTHPAHDGIGITGRNDLWCHIESFGDWDQKRMPQSCVDGFRFLLRLLSERRGQPVKINPGPSMNNPATWQGGLFHRDAKTDIKSCPGNTTTHDWFDAAMTRPGPTPGDSDLVQVRRRARLLSGSQSDSPQAGTLLPGALARVVGATPSPDGLVQVRLTGYVKQSSLGPRDQDPGMTLQSRLMAPPRATAVQSTAYRLGHPHGGYSEADVRWIVGMYYSLSQQVGLDPLFVDAQGFLETGGLTSWWSQVPRRNPAGIGVTGEPGEGVTFADWQSAVRAHVGRVLAYALKVGEETAAQGALIAEALQVRPLDERYRGCAPRVGDWGGGVWATDTEYAPKIVRIAGAIRNLQSEPS
jgi:hypothetical protein